MSNKLKKIPIIFFLLILIGGVFISSPIQAYADDPNFNSLQEGYDYIMNEDNDYGGFTQTAAKMVYEVFGGSQNLLAGTKKLLDTTDGGGDTLTGAIWDASENIYEAVEAVGISIMLLYFLLDILDKTSREQLSLELFLKSFIKLIVAFAFITSGIEFVQGLIDFTSAMLSDVLTKLQIDPPPTGTAGVAEMEKLAKDANGIKQAGNALAVIIDIMIPYFGMLICKIVVSVVAYGRLIEIGLRTGFAPIGMSDIVTSGSNGHGFRYLKKLVAVGIQGVFILAILYLYKALTAAIIPSGDQVVEASIYTLKALAISATTVTLLIKSQSFANDLMGV